MSFDTLAHRRAVEKFYRREVITSIDFRTALDAVSDIARSWDVPATFFCKRDIDRLQEAVDNISAKIQRAQEELREANAPRAFVQALGPGPTFIAPPDVVMSIFPLDEYSPNNC